MHGGQIYHCIYNKAFDELFLRLRGQFGGESILMKDIRRILDPAETGRKVMIGFIADQLPKLENMNHWTHFLNHETSFFYRGRTDCQTGGRCSLLRGCRACETRILSGYFSLDDSSSERIC